MGSKVDEIVQRKEAENEKVAEAFRDREAAQQAMLESGREKLEAVQV